MTTNQPVKSNRNYLVDVKIRHRLQIRWALVLIHDTGPCLTNANDKSYHRNHNACTHAALLSAIFA